MTPKVNYTSYGEYELLQQQLKRDYRSMISDGLEIVKEKLVTWAEYHEGPSMGVNSHWYGEGITLWLKLTKGTDESWCEVMSAVLLHALMTTCSTAFAVHKMTSRKRQRNQQIFDMLLPLLLSTADMFIDPDYHPNHLDPYWDLHFDCDDDGKCFVKQSVGEPERCIEIKAQT